jgi:hypothetical protein
VLNRADARMTIFAAPGEYETGDREAFEQVLAEAAFPTVVKVASTAFARRFFSLIGIFSAMCTTGTADKGR